MSEVLQYMTISGKSDKANEFVTLVNQYIEKGWTPQGGVSVASLSNSFGVFFMFQAMVMFKNKPTE